MRWGIKACIYNTFDSVPLVEVVAEAETVTVFLESTTRWPFRNNDAYWDNAWLVEAEEEKPRGLPREQYQLTYVLLPPDAGADWAQAVVAATWDRERFTIGGSADDAGIGDLDYRRVIAVNPSEWGNDLGAWYNEHYPGVIYKPVTADSPEQLGRLLGLPEAVE